MSITLTRDAVADLLDTLRGAVAAIDAGEPVGKARLGPAVAAAEGLLEAAEWHDRLARASAIAAMVAEFHEHRYSTGRAATVALTPRLHAEEHDELLDAIADDDPVVLAGDHATGPVLAIHDAADLRDYEQVIAAAVNQGMFVYAASSGAGGAGVQRYETPDINSRPQRRRVAADALVVSAADLTAYDWPSLEAMPDAELARRARVLLAVPDGIAPLIVTYADAAIGAAA